LITVLLLTSTLALTGPALAADSPSGSIVVDASADEPVQCSVDGDDCRPEANFQCEPPLDDVPSEVCYAVFCTVSPYRCTADVGTIVDDCLAGDSGIPGCEDVADLREQLPCSGTDCATYDQPRVECYWGGDEPPFMQCYVQK